MAVLTVTELNRHIRIILEQDVGEVSVAGEVSNLSKPASGHFYFTMKDVTAQVRCVFFHNRHLSQHRELQNGQSILVKGKVSVYEARGDYQLIVEELSEAGLGQLHQLFEALKLKLAAQGLFDPLRKKLLPRFPQCIGIITSTTGAAIRDILATLARRFAYARVIIYPSDVQGKSATPQLIQAIQQASADKQCDVLILARGGGSLEDLWAFNDESLVRAIALSDIPIVSGVGHETDFTLSDFVADLRAATPTAAAEAVTPDQTELIAYFNATQQRLVVALKRLIQHKQLLLHHEIKKMMSPSRLIATHWQTLDYLSQHLLRLMQQTLLSKKHHLHLLITRLSAQHTGVLVRQASMQIQRLENQLIQVIDTYLQKLKQQLHALFMTLNAVSPLATLDRGYALVTHENHVLFESQAVKPGELVDIRLAKGQLICEVVTCIK